MFEVRSEIIWVSQCQRADTHRAEPVAQHVCRQWQLWLRSSLGPRERLSQKAPAVLPEVL